MVFESVVSEYEGVENGLKSAKMMIVMIYGATFIFYCETSNCDDVKKCVLR